MIIPLSSLFNDSMNPVIDFFIIFVMFNCDVEWSVGEVFNAEMRRIDNIIINKFSYENASDVLLMPW